MAFITNSTPVNLPELGGAHPIKVLGIEVLEGPLKQDGPNRPRIAAKIQIVDPTGEKQYTPITSVWFLPDFPTEPKEIQGRMVQQGELFSWSAKRFNNQYMNQLLMNFIKRGTNGSPEAARFNEYMKNYGSGKTEDTPLIDTQEKLLADVKAQVGSVQKSVQKHRDSERVLYGFFIWKGTRVGENIIHRMNLFIPSDNDLPKVNGYSTAAYFPSVHWKNHETVVRADGSSLVPDNILERTVKGWDVVQTPETDW
jgi:hypothetical protein